MKPGQGVTLLRNLPTTGPFFVPAGTAGIVLFAYPTWARVAWQGYGEATANVSDLKPATLTVEHKAITRIRAEYQDWRMRKAGTTAQAAR